MKERKITLPVKGMTCANCSGTIERVLNKKVTGVIKASVNLATEKVVVTYDQDVTTEKNIISAIEKAGYSVPDISDRDDEVRQTLKLKLGIIFSIPVFVLSMSRDFGLPGNLSHSVWINWLMCILTLPVQFYVGLDYYIGAWKALKNFSPNMDVLISLGSSIAFFFSLFVTIGLTLGNNILGEHVYFETAAVIITLIKLGKTLEARSKGQTGSAIKKLMALKPKRARVFRDDREIDIPVEEIKIDDIIIIRPGEKIPADGIIIEGSSTLDESMLTGESIPVDKKNGDNLFSGTINKQGFLKFKAIKVGEETVLSQIIKSVQEAQGSKAPIQRIADYTAAIFVPVIIVIAIITFFIWFFLGYGFTQAMIRMVAVLVIACPCALGLATPTAIIVATGKGAEKGILFKNGEALEKTHTMKILVLDKTGTITEGKPVVTEVIGLKENTSEWFRLAASLEKGSEHPLGEAIIKEAYKREEQLSEPKDIKFLEGMGITGLVEGKKIIAGNLKIMEEANIEFNFSEKIEKLQSGARTIIFVSIDGIPSGIIGIADTIKKGAGEALHRIQKMGIETIMLTGDNKITAEAVAREAGINRVMAEIMPVDKALYVKELQSKGDIIGMTGDGINDAPALAQADIGISMGTGTDIAIEASHITIISGDLRAIPEAVSLSKETLKIIKQNLFWAFFYNIILIPIAAGALYSIEFLPPVVRSLNPMIGAFAMAFSSVTVVMNSLRLRHY